jgi:hypothetical protein
MRLLTQIFHKPDLSLSGNTVTREAVRAIILHGDQMLMVYSTLNGDYKFPGGGVKQGETHAIALQREFDLFRMNSYDYLCEVEDGFDAQNLDDYEQEYASHRNR